MPFSNGTNVSFLRVRVLKNRSTFSSPSLF
jgi:hypothetical protein